MEFEINQESIDELSQNYEISSEIILCFIEMINSSKRVTFQEQFNYILEYCLSLISSYQDIYLGEFDSDSYEFAYPTYNQIIKKVICEELGVNTLNLLKKYDIKCDTLFNNKSEDLINIKKKSL